MLPKQEYILLMSSLKITNPVALTAIAIEPSKQELDSAKELLFLHAMVDTVEAFNKKKAYKFAS